MARIHVQPLLGLNGSPAWVCPACAIGAALAARNVHLCPTGDAGLAMMLGEPGVLSRCDMPVTVIVLNDGAIDLIRSHQSAGKPVFATEFTPPVFKRAARAFGLPAQRASDEAQLTWR